MGVALSTALIMTVTFWILFLITCDKEGPRFQEPTKYFVEGKLVKLMREGTWVREYFESRDSYDTMHESFTIFIIVTGGVALTFIFWYLLATGFIEIFFS